MGWIVEGRTVRVRAAVRTLHRWMSGPQFFCAFLLSGLLNAILLSSSLYLFHIYERVLPAGNRVGLVLSTAMLAGLIGAFALLDFLRARLLGRAGACFVGDLETRCRRGGDGGRGDVERVRRFLACGGPAALFDLSWLPMSLLGLWLVHPLLGLYAFVSAILISGIAIGGDVAFQTKGFEISDGKLAVVAVSKAIRLMLQFGGIGLGALLVIERAISAGGLIAATLIMGRAFAGLDGALAHWRSSVAAARSLGVLISSDEPCRASVVARSKVSPRPLFSWRTRHPEGGAIRS